VRCRGYLRRVMGIVSAMPKALRSSTPFLSGAFPNVASNAPAIDFGGTHHAQLSPNSDR